MTPREILARMVAGCPLEEMMNDDESVAFFLGSQLIPLWLVRKLFRGGYLDAPTPDRIIVTDKGRAVVAQIDS